MKVLMLTDVFYPDTVGGSGRVVYNLCFELSKLGHTVYVVTRNPNFQLDSFQKITKRFNICRFSTPTNKPFRMFPVEILNSYTSVNELKRKFKFDIICIHQCMSAVGPSFIRQLIKIPIIYCYHSPWHLEYLTRLQGINPKATLNGKLIASVMRWIEYQFLTRSFRIVVLSNYMKNKVISLHKITQAKISIIPGGVDVTRFDLPVEKISTLKLKLGIPETKILFVTLRNLVPRMGIDNLIECFHRSQIIRDKSSLLIGGSGPLEGYLKSLVQSYNLKKHIRFLGHVLDEKLPELYQAANFFILPTATLEGFGLVILESMACGTPVLGTPIGAIPDILGQFDRRLIFEGNDWKSIKMKLEEIVNTPDRYEFHPERCREFVENNFSWERMAFGFEKIFLNSRGILSNEAVQVHVSI